MMHTHTHICICICIVMVSTLCCHVFTAIAFVGVGVVFLFSVAVTTNPQQKIFICQPSSISTFYISNVFIWCGVGPTIFKHDVFIYDNEQQYIIY